MVVALLTFHHVGVAHPLAPQQPPHAPHHTHVAPQAPHEAPHHPRHPPGVARHLLDDLEPRILASLRLQQPGKELQRSTRST